ncbi:MAG: VWA domain-containing protein [Firmicutes bacterium]|nr:VWA domain-containing protein [Bacillota bacterium]
MDNLWWLVRGLRRAQFSLSTADLALGIQALELVDVANPHEVEAALAALWCRDLPSRQLFHAVFEQWVLLLRRQHPEPVSFNTYLAQVARRRREDASSVSVTWFRPGAESGSIDQPLTVALGASREEVWRYRPLDRLSQEELDQLMAWYRPRPPLLRPSAIQQPALRGGSLNLGETMRRGREGSEWVRLYFDRPRREPLRVTIMLDLSGSTHSYHRPLLQFFHAMMRHERGLNVYGFSTRLTRLTEALRSVHIDRALAEVSQLAPDRGGGTRIADSMRQLWERERGRGITGRSTLIMISDGLEEGDKRELERWVLRWDAFLHHRVHWWNPWMATDPGTMRTPSLQVLGRYTQYRAIPTLAALAEAWQGLSTDEPVFRPFRPSL